MRVQRDIREEYPGKFILCCLTDEIICLGKAFAIYFLNRTRFPWHVEDWCVCTWSRLFSRIQHCDTEQPSFFVVLSLSVFLIGVPISFSFREDSRLWECNIFSGSFLRTISRKMTSSSSSSSPLVYTDVLCVVEIAAFGLPFLCFLFSLPRWKHSYSRRA